MKLFFRVKFALLINFIILQYVFLRKKWGELCFYSQYR